MHPILDTNRVKVQGWQKIHHVNVYIKKTKCISEQGKLSRMKKLFQYEKGIKSLEITVC